MASCGPLRWQRGEGHPGEALGSEMATPGNPQGSWQMKGQAGRARGEGQGDTDAGVDAPAGSTPVATAVLSVQEESSEVRLCSHLL